MMKKLLAILLSMVLLLSLAACASEDIQKSKDDQDPSTPQKPEQKDPPVDPYADLPAAVDDIQWDFSVETNGLGGLYIGWNGWEITDALSSALDESDGTNYLAILVSKYDPDFQDTFVYKGMTEKEALDEREKLSYSNKRYDEVMKEIDQRRQAHRASYADELKTVFAKANPVVRNGYVFLFLHKDELVDLEIEGKENYRLSLATRYQYAGTVENIFSEVTGFDVDKLEFDFDTSIMVGHSWSLTSDEDVITVFHKILWYYPVIEHSCRIEFTVQSEKPLTEEDLMHMNYKSFKQGSDPQTTVIEVMGDRLNLQALRDLTQREDVTSIVVHNIL